MEAIEDADGRWIVGVQWHPEDTAERDAEQQRIFRAFVAATKARRARADEPRRDLADRALLDRQELGRRRAARAAAASAASRRCRSTATALREALPWPTGYEREERLALARLYGRLAREFVRQGHLVICSTVSLFHEVQAWNREHIPGYFEVWLRAPADELRVARPRRRARRLHGRARRGRRPRARAGVPAHAGPVVDNHGATTPPAAARLILDRARCVTC